MPTIDVVKEGVPDKAFWEDVFLVLTDIYGKNREDAEAKIGRRLKDLFKADPWERALITHDNPVYIGASLIGAQAGEKEMKKFRELTKKRADRR
jgi:hypothetical protein